MKSLRLWVGVSLFGLMIGQVAAQVDCPSIVQEALSATDQACSAIGRNQACYGNIDLEAIPREGAETLAFNQPGDLVNVVDVQQFRLSPLDLTGESWGVALMKLQANLPDTLPGQNVTFLLFGNVEIENAVEPVSAAAVPDTVTLPVTVSSMAPFMESLTSTDAPEMLTNGTQATADGRDPSGQMLHIILDDGRAGWTMAQMVTIQGDVSTLPEVDLLSGETTEAATESTPAQTPMQAFYFRSGVGDAPCEQAPDSGILIQTPEGSGQIKLTMNGVDLQLGSTAYVQSSDELTVNVVEGNGLVAAQGVTRVVPAGMRVRVPQEETDGRLTASGPPSEPEPYDEAALAALPVGHLERDISIAPALTALTAGVDPQPGVWNYVTGEVVLGTGCPPELASMMGAFSLGNSETITIPEGAFDFQSVIALNGGENMPGAVFSNPEPGLHVMEASGDGTTMRFELRVISPTYIEITNIITFEGCTMTIPAEMLPA